VAISCGSCGAGLRDGARFCDSCGSPIAAADSHAEYKQVTVLFADVVHSMDIAAAVGPERLREIVGELFRRSSVIVQRYGGTVDKFTGDGIMAVFGAPIALEDHAARACRAALDIQTDTRHLAAEVEPRDNISLQLRIGLNSGEAITGEIGSGPTSYTAVGEQVGMAQRMESAAPTGGVMVSDSTARLVESVALLGDPELVHIKGAQEPVPARVLLGMAAGRRADRNEPTFVGRQREMGALGGVLQRSINGNGSVVGLVGPPGIGKSRVVRELTAQAKGAGVEVFATYCESHTTDLPFHGAAGLLRSVTRLEGLDDAAARQQVRERFPGAPADDLLLMDDLLGIGDPAAAMPQIDADARRRRLAAVVKATALNRTMPVVYIIEDAHWIDGISESLLAEFLAVIPQTPSLVVVTYRPEYAGVLARTPRSQTIALEPLDDSQMSELSNELLGNDSSVAELAAFVAERAAGNPFFAEEIVRDLSERDVLVGGRGCYLCAEPVDHVHVPRTLQAVIAARIDRLSPAAKRTLNGAAVIGSRFNLDMLEAIGVDVALGDLVTAELIDQTAFSPKPEYAFRHALIRAVAYESQLRSDRAQLHRRFSAAIEQDDQNAALIAEHLEAAGDLRSAFDWHMRAGAWSLNRDHAAAQLSWERALVVADALPAKDPESLSLRIAPRCLLCSNSFRSFHPDMSARFEELRDLCNLAGDKASLAIGMTGLVMEHVIRNRQREASELASENMALIESIDDPALTVALSFAPCVAKIQVGELDDALRWSQKVIDVADDETNGDSIILGSPVAMARAFCGLLKCHIGHPGWRDEQRRAIEMSRQAEAISYAAITSYSYNAIAHRALIADDAVVDQIESALRISEEAGEDIAVVLTRMTMAIALIERDPPGADRGYEMAAELCETCIRESYAMNIVSPLHMYASWRLRLRGDYDGAVEVARESLKDLFNSDNLISCDACTNSLVEALLARGTENDLVEAGRAIERLAAIVPGQQWAVRDAYVLRLRALLAQARGDDAAYRQWRDQYRALATEHGYEGHIIWAAEMA
jgi:class 3 adenylate cyclase